MYLNWQGLQKHFHHVGTKKNISQNTDQHCLYKVYAQCHEVCVCVCVCVCVQSCRLFCDPMDCIPSGSYVHGISQVRILEWVAISYSRGSPWPRDLTCVSYGSWIADRFFTTEPLGKPWTSSSVRMADPKKLKRRKVMLPWIQWWSLGNKCPLGAL